MLRSGIQESMPYCLSRYTDVPGAKWPWFEQCLAARRMIAFDQRIGVPNVWSLAPDDTLALVFWTKDPSNLIASQLRLQPYHTVVNMTATGWQEVEKGAPSIQDAGRLLVETCVAFERVHWRFSPIPLLPDAIVLERFKVMLEWAARADLREVLVSYLQPNDGIQESRTLGHRLALLNQLAETSSEVGIETLLCQDDRSFEGEDGVRFATAPCVPSTDFVERRLPGSFESCACVSMVDPFTINESCVYGCHYCYAGDKTLATKKRNTTRGLQVVLSHGRAH